MRGVMRKGKFITFEGCDGCGKTSQMRMLIEYLRERGYDVLSTREPGGAEVSEKIRTIILDSAYDAMHPVAESLLYAASRVQHYNELIRPAVAAGKLVICDRYIDSSLAYQGSGRGLGYKFVLMLFKMTLKNAMPDLTIFIDVKPSVAFKRKGGVDENDRIESAGADFHNKVYEGYMYAAKKFPKRVAVIDASGTKFETRDKIRKLLKNRGIIN